MFGRLLTVDLSTGRCAESTLPADYVRDYIGGSGLGVRLLWDTLRPDLDPLAPENPLLWITGPLTGSNGPTTGRFTVCGRSPQTGLWGESNLGGMVGPELRYAGYDAVLVTGRAPEPVYLWVHDGQAELRSAARLWGQADTYATQQLIRAELAAPKARVACIGRAGENGVPYAGILADHGRAAGRTGLGALMGSKHLKALAVLGTQPVPLAQPEEYKRLRLAANKALLDENMTAIFRETGTSGAADYLQLMGDMPQKYWTQATFEAASNIGGATMAQTILTGHRACQGCVIGCGREVNVPDGPYATPGKVKGPEYETLCAFGSQLLVDNLPLIVALGNRCDAVGIDTISAGNTIALAYLLFERGYLTAQDTGGVELRWGDATPCLDFIEQIADRRGFGALLAQGSLALATHFGAAELAVHVNNLEVPMHDPRASTGQALAYITSPRGACHNQGDYFSVEMGSTSEELGLPMTDRLADAGKAGYVARHQNWRTACNDLVICFFAVVPASTLVDLLSAATGHPWSLDRMLLAGERGWNLKRVYNCRLGWTRARETLPKLLLQPLPDGGQAGTVPNQELLLKEYYAARDWDEATGLPTPPKLAALGLDWVTAAMK
jgi:aldehyde:ferredoxin oxidoreductase